ncbi:hypothetical protein RN97_01780 [Fusobacterium hwasookii ChDC F300]|nr:hypothetical protein [Fusobacterium hwasookii]ALQ36959.1 hypothetical protein RN97_01780 [Fusobacterium hwasookii ChDC F300]
MVKINKYENIGGGISIGTDVPNISVKHDKEQINRATAINTDFEISGKKTSAEDLGFNTDINKAQEVTKDEGKKGEETAIHRRGKIGSENKNKIFTNEEINNMKAFKRASDKLQKLRAEGHYD